MEAINAGWTELARAERKAKEKNRQEHLGRFAIGQVIMFREIRWKIIDITKDVTSDYHAVLEMIDFGGPREKISIEYLNEYAGGVK